MGSRPLYRPPCLDKVFSSLLPAAPSHPHSPGPHPCFPLAVRPIWRVGVNVQEVDQAFRFRCRHQLHLAQAAPFLWMAMISSTGSFRVDYHLHIVGATNSFTSHKPVYVLPMEMICSINTAWLSAGTFLLSSTCDRCL